MSQLVQRYFSRVMHSGEKDILPKTDLDTLKSQIRELTLSMGHARSGLDIHDDNR